VRAAGATARDRGEELGGRGAVKWIKIYGFGKGRKKGGMGSARRRWSSFTEAEVDSASSVIRE
jgi:hypothetical protein